MQTYPITTLLLGARLDDRASFERLLRTARRVFDAPRALLALQGGDGWTAAAVSGEIADAAGVAAAVGALAEKPSLVADLTSDLRARPFAALSDAGHRAMAAWPLCDEAGRRVGVLGVLDDRVRVFGPDDIEALRDLAETFERSLIHARLEDALRRNHTFLDALLDSVQVALIACDLDGRLTVFNRAARDVHGLDAEAIPPDELFDWFRLFEADGRTPMPTERTPLMRALAGETIDHVEMVAVPPQRAPMTMVVSARAVIDVTGQRRGAVAAVQDITEAKRVAEELERARAEAERASRAKSEFLANMSHELRTPLNAIIGYAEMLEESYAELDPEEAVADLRKVQSAGRTLLRLINDLLDLSKIDAGRMELTTEPVDVAGVVAAVVDALSPSAAQRGNALSVAIVPTLPLVEADAEKLRRVLENLLANAIKFTKGGRIEVGVAHEAEELVLRVTDTGTGIAFDQLDKLFTVFSQGDGSTTRAHGGAGLGLALSRRFALMMGGDITVESAPGEGSTFSVRLPLRAAEL